MILRPLSAIYGKVAALRNRLFDCGLRPVYGVRIPVISVGNLTAGGNGKTPLCIYIAEVLTGMGRAPVILSRGYRGRERGPLLVRPENDVADVGDEPLLMAQNFKVVVSKDRVEGAKFIQEENHGDVIVLDDGFQHRRLGRALDLVCINAGSDRAVGEFLSGRLLPEGLFREPMEQGLLRASAFVLSERRILKTPPPVPPLLAKILPKSKPVFRSWLQSAGVFSLCDGCAPAAKRAVAFSGLASPDGFFDTLESLGFELLAKRAFPDHYLFRDSDLKELRGFGVPLICSQKDAARLSGGMRRGIFALSVRTQLDRPQEFAALLMDAAGSSPVPGQ